jgi:hypothetical protein
VLHAAVRPQRRRRAPRVGRGAATNGKGDEVKDGHAEALQQPLVEVVDERQRRAAEVAARVEHKEGRRTAARSHTRGGRRYTEGWVGVGGTSKDDGEDTGLND